ncbi:hypothetical protein PP352_21350 [Mycobacteroides abscessus]|nr:hypothetical protein [Mycobacteroides abscessus]
MSGHEHRTVAVTDLHDGDVLLYAWKREGDMLQHMPFPGESPAFRRAHNRIVRCSRPITDDTGTVVAVDVQFYNDGSVTFDTDLLVEVSDVQPWQIHDIRQARSSAAMWAQWARTGQWEEGNPYGGAARVVHQQAGAAIPAWLHRSKTPPPWLRQDAPLPTVTERSPQA